MIPSKIKIFSPSRKDFVLIENIYDTEVEEVETDSFTEFTIIQNDALNKVESSLLRVLLP